MKKLRERTDDLAKSLLLPINPAAVVILGIYTFVWGLWVASPFWSVFGRAELYSLLGSLAPEVFWGCLAIFCGLVTIYGAYSKRYKPLLIGSAVAAWHWGMIAIFYFLADAGSTGGITALTFGLYAIYVHLNIKTNFKNNKNSADILHHKKD